MKNANGITDIPTEFYKDAIQTLTSFTTLILLSFAQHPNEKKDIIIRSFIARAIVSLKGMVKLWEIEDNHDCLVLFRCLLDRLFLLYELNKNNTFEIFNKWSFIQQYEYMNKIRNDQNFKDKLDATFFNVTDEQNEKYKQYKNENPKWGRPRAKDVAKEMDLEFLYDYGYDYASTIVHPMANDGQEDFSRLTKIEVAESFPNHKITIHNSCLITMMIIRNGMTYSNFIWRGVINEFLDNFYNFLNTGSKKEYMDTFVKIGKIGPDVDWCKSK
jgi:hypothetical protein